MKKDLATINDLLSKLSPDQYDQNSYAYKISKQSISSHVDSLDRCIQKKIAIVNIYWDEICKELTLIKNNPVKRRAISNGEDLMTMLKPKISDKAYKAIENLHYFVKRKYSFSHAYVNVVEYLDL